MCFHILSFSKETLLDWINKMSEGTVNTNYLDI